jgi:hypothetical protein
MAEWRNRKNRQEDHSARLSHPLAGAIWRDDLHIGAKVAECCADPSISRRERQTNASGSLILLNCRLVGIGRNDGELSSTKPFAPPFAHFGDSLAADKATELGSGHTDSGRRVRPIPETSAGPPSNPAWSAAGYQVG